MLAGLQATLQLAPYLAPSLAHAFEQQDQKPRPQSHLKERNRCHNVVEPGALKIRLLIALGQLRLHGGLDVVVDPTLPHLDQAASPQKDQKQPRLALPTHLRSMALR